MTAGAVLADLPPDTSAEDVRAHLGIAAGHGVVCRWASAEPAAYGVLVLGVEVDGLGSAHLAYRARGRPQQLAGRPEVGAGMVFVVANNVLGGRDAEFDRWYDDVHIPHTFDYFGFTAAQRFAAVDGRAAFQRMVAYASPADRGRVEAAMAWAAADRERAARSGREPSVPVSDAVTAPRHAGFYAACE